MSRDMKTSLYTKEAFFLAFKVEHDIGRLEYSLQRAKVYYHESVSHKFHHSTDISTAMGSEVCTRSHRDIQHQFTTVWFVACGREVFPPVWLLKSCMHST